MKPKKGSLGRYERNNSASYGGLSRYWGLGDREHRAASSAIPMVSQPAQMIAPPPSFAPAVEASVAPAAAAPSYSPPPSSQNAPPGTSAVNPSDATGYQPYQEQQQQLPFQYALMFPGLIPGLQPPIAPPVAAPVPAQPKLTPLAIPESVRIETGVRGEKYKVSVTKQQAKIGKIAAIIAAYWLLV